MTDKNKGPDIGHVIRTRRMELGLELEDLAELVELDQSRLQVAESSAEEELKIAELSELSRFLGIDLELYDPEVDEAPEELPQVITLLKSNENYLPNRDWTTVVDAAGIAAQTCRLEQWMEGLPDRHEELRQKFRPRSLSDQRPWEQGQFLAMEVRDTLGFGADPIDSTYQLCQDLGILIVEAFLPVSVSALCLSDSHHGPTIILNIQGTNDSLLPRRFAIAHEICHILFDEYDMERLQRFDNAPGFFEAKNKPGIEKRADAFAIHLLCPEGAVRAHWLHAEQNNTPLEERIRQLIETFGVSFTAIKGHLQNLNLLSHRDANTLSTVNTDTPQRFLDAEERANPTAYETSFAPLSRLRRGQFLIRILAAYRDKLVTRSAVLEMLDVDADTLDDHVESWTARLLDNRG